MIVTKGSTSVSVPFYFVDDVGGTAPGEPTTGLLFSDIETGGSASYQRQGAARVAFTLKTLANAATAYDAGGFILVDDTEMAGTYRCDIPDTAVAAGVDFVIIYLRAAGANNTITRPLRIDLTTFDLRSAAPDVNVLQISSDADAANNLELMYDGTGYTDDSAPASRDQVTGLAVSSSAVNIRTIAAPNGFTLTTGSEVNDEDSTHALDGTKHELTDAAGTLDGYYEFNIEADGLPVSVTITGVYNSNNDVFQIYANAGTDGTPVWQQVGEIDGTNSSAVFPRSFDLFSDQIVTDIVGRVQIRIAATGLSTASFDVDQIFVSKAIVTRSIGYDGGAVWVDSNNGIAGVVPYVNGVADRHSDSIANAYTIAAALPTPLTDFHILNGSTIPLVASAASKSFFGDEWTLQLEGQAIGGAHIEGAEVSGVSTSAARVSFEGCAFGTSSIQLGRFDFCRFTDVVTHTLAGDYSYHNCKSGVAGPGSPTFGKTAGQAITANYRDWAGSITFSGLEAGDTLTVGGTLGTIDLGSPAGAVAVEIRGTYKELVNVGSAVVNTDGAIKGVDVASILADTVLIGTPTDTDIATDIANVQTTANAIPTTAMRGTDSALLASTFTTMFTGITTLAQWLGLIAGKQTGNTIARNEMRATGAGSGTYDETVNSLEAGADNVGTAGAGLTDLGGMSTAMKAEVNAEVVDVLETDTHAEPGQGTPSATLSLRDKIGYLFKWTRNESRQTATTRSHFNDAGTTVDQKATVSDDATTATRGKMGTGP